MKITVIPVALFSIGAVYLLTPPETKESLIESWRRFSDDPGQVCFDFERKSLNDSITARLLSSEINPSKPDEVRIRYQAKNGFGAYIPGEVVCIIKSGKVSVALTELAREVERLDKKNECLSDTIKRRRRGEDVSAVQCP